MSQFISDLTKRIRDNGIKINQDETKIIINTLINLINEKVFEGHIIKIKNFATFELGKTSNSRKLPNGKDFKQSEIIKVKLSKNFKNKR